MNTIVNFKTAKLLKEKGFKSKNKYYDTEGSIDDVKAQDILGSDYRYTNNAMQRFRWEAPTIAEVVMWLYEKHQIWIIVTPIPYSDNLTHWRWEHVSTNYATRNANWKKQQDYNSPTEAYEAAIEYCLTKLI